MGYKRVTSSTCAFLIIVISFFIISCGTSNNSSTTTVSGNVLDINGEPLENAEVTISSDPVTATTDSNGFFSVEVETGSHEISIMKGTTEVYFGSFNAQEGSTYSLDYMLTTHAPDDSSDKLLLKLDGFGLFVLSDTLQDRYYSRHASFSLDDEGYLVNYKGYRLQGYGYSNFTGYATTVLGDIQLSVQLSDIEISSAGVITYSDNGETVNAAQIVLAKFISPQNLQTSDNIHCEETAKSGQPIITSSGSTGTGQIVSGSLEGAYECDRGDIFFNKKTSINGSGYFRLLDNETDTVVYALEFPAGLDKQGYLANQSGFRVQGYLASYGTITDVLGDINIASFNSGPELTSEINVSANLDSSETVPSSTFDVDDPDNTSNFSSSISTYDSLGTSHTINIYYRKSAENAWQWFAVVGSSDSQHYKTEVQAQGSLTFNNSGALVSESAISYPRNGFDFAGGCTQNQIITFDFGISTTEEGTELEDTTQFSAQSATVSIEQNGYSAGSVKGSAIESDGTVNGTFTNGITEPLGQIVLTTFPSPGNLESYDSYTWRETSDSGSPRNGTPGTGSYGTVLFEDIE